MKRERLTPPRERSERHPNSVVRYDRGGRVALGAATRARILSAIKVLGDPTIFDLMRHVRVSQGTINRHLRTLRKRGYVKYAAKRTSDLFYVNRFRSTAKAWRSRDA
jgi:DNA-binding transcriptional ArsR family regulator